jgi:hypothetical protein
MMTEISVKISEAFGYGPELGLIRAALRYRAEHATCAVDRAEYAELYTRLGGENEIAPYRAHPLEAAEERNRKARSAYETERRVRPFYDDGSPRPPWEKLDYIAQWSWERNPTPRWVSVVEEDEE